MGNWLNLTQQGFTLCKTMSSEVWHTENSSILNSSILKLCSRVKRGTNSDSDSNNIVSAINMYNPYHSGFKKNLNIE